MVIGRPTKYGTGIKVCGDYYDLSSLHEMIWHLVETTQEVSPENTMIMSFAFSSSAANGMNWSQIATGSRNLNTVLLLPMRFPNRE